MRDIYRLLWTFVGAIVGFGVGLLLYFGVYRLFPEVLGTQGAVSLLVVFALAGGGMVGLGSLALWLTVKVQKARWRKQRDQKKKFGDKRRKQ